MKFPWLTIVVAVALLVGFTSALLPNAAMVPMVMKARDTSKPENTMMGESLKDLGIAICPDKLHLCPATAECCEKDDGKWDCCPKKTTASLTGDCCYQFGIWWCCTDLVPKCHWWGCWWS